MVQPHYDGHGPHRTIGEQTDCPAESCAGMTLLPVLHSGWATILICTLLFVEEAGVPLPFAPGDGLLVVGGLVVAAGLVQAWVFIPVALVAVISGALVGYSWSRLFGAKRLRSAAQLLGARRSLERVSTRLQAASPLGIAVCRLIPGLRVYTTLVAGAIGVRRRTFLLGAVPATVVWVITFTVLGIVVGAPAGRYLEHLDKVAVRSGVLLAIGIGAFLALRYAPGGRQVPSAPGPWRIVAAVFIDAGIVGSVAAGLSTVVRLIFHSHEPDNYFEILAAIGALAFLYIFVSRFQAGTTAGEAALAVSYRPRRRDGRRHRFST